uniref:Uncharacterized protein n=1 Tax=Chlamydomonas leiostraca TaxID=1034604 RepID=A0A7S0WSS3_9CHLO
MAAQMPPATNGTWSTGFCDCCAAPGGWSRCCYSGWCPCLLAGDNFARMEPNAVMCGGSWGGACLTYCAAEMCIGGPCIPQMMGRSYIRRKFGIQGSEFEDFMLTWCCSPCALCQEAREIDIRCGAGQPIGASGGVVMGSPAMHAPVPMATK